MRELATSLANIAAMTITACPAWRVTARQLPAKTMMAGVGNLPEFRQAPGLPPSFSQAPNPCEWVPGLGWRSHREATPGGRPKRGGCELDNGSRGRWPPALSALRMSRIGCCRCRVPGAHVPGGRPNAEPGTGAPAVPRSGAALDLRTAQFGNANGRVRCRAFGLRRAGGLRAGLIGQGDDDAHGVGLGRQVGDFGRGLTTYMRTSGSKVNAGHPGWAAD